MALSMSEQACYTLIAAKSDVGPAGSTETPTDVQIRNSLEKGDNKAKAETLKRLITMIVNGENVGRDLLMYVIRFCLPSQDHLIKKLLLIFWEVVPKTSPDGKLLQEMILVCDAYRKDLQHPNEFIRGSTLRFLCKLKEPELIEPLMPAIRACLEHRHSYVRRNAVMAIYTIYRNFEFLIPDAPELVYNFLEAEQDASCRRNAFMMLLHADQARALDYLQSCIDQVNQFGEILQLIIVELIYKVCHTNPSERARFIRCVYNLLQSSSAAVRYEAAGTLLTLSVAPTAVRAAAQAYVELILKESDNNVKLIVLDRLCQLRLAGGAGERVLQDLAMDVLRVLQAPDLDVRRKTLALVLDLVNGRNVEEVVLFLRKEITRATSGGSEETGQKYRQMLVRALHAVSAKFSDTAASVVPALLECLSDQSDQAAGDVLVFVRDACARLPSLRPVILQNLAAVFGSIRDVKIFRAALWILGEFCETDETIQAVMTLIRQSLGELPIVESESRLEAEKEDDTSDPSKDTAMRAQVKQLVTADGTYKTESALSMGQNKDKRSGTGSAERPSLRKFIMQGDFFVASALASVLCKLAIRFAKLKTEKRAASNAFSGEALYIMACLLHVGRSALPTKQMTEDDLDRIATCFRVLADGCPGAEPIYAHRCRKSLELMLSAKKVESVEEFKGIDRDGEKKSSTPVDQGIVYPQLASRLDASEQGKENLFDLSLSQALGVVNAAGTKGGKIDFSTASKLGKVTQLSGMNDPVYAEAYINVNQYDIVLDVLVVNQTGETLENVTLELATLGDLRMVEKPTPLTLAPHDFANIKANAKVASTENSVIFGTIVYDVRGSTSDRNAVYLLDIHIDIMDYIVPAHCTDQQFRGMWAEFEWENKVAVNTSITDLRQFLDHLVSSTNMRCLTPDEALTGDCGLLAANLYAHSVFGEDALANLSIEKLEPDDPSSAVVGHIRIRAKSQGMALSLGDKVNSAQKQTPQQTSQGKLKNPKNLEGGEKIED